MASQWVLSKHENRTDIFGIEDNNIAYESNPLDLNVFNLNIKDFQNYEAALNNHSDDSIIKINDYVPKLTDVFIPSVLDLHHILIHPLEVPIFRWNNSAGRFLSFDEESDAQWLIMVGETNSSVQYVMDLKINKQKQIVPFFRKIDHDKPIHTEIIIQYGDDIRELFGHTNHLNLIQDAKRKKIKNIVPYVVSMTFLETIYRNSTIYKLYTNPDSKGDLIKNEGTIRIDIK